MKNKVIGIVGNTLVSNTPFGDMERAYVNSTYVKGILRAGGVPLIIPCFGEVNVIRQQAEICDAFVFSGGGDIDPSRYGEEPDCRLGEIDPAIDAFQLSLYREVEKSGKPVLGICRGLQIINTVRAGNLYQDINKQIPDSYQHVQSGKRTHSVHKVVVEEKSKLFEIMGQSELAVNSLHHQSIRKLGKGLRISARAGDGVVEAIESLSGDPIIGVQWHPEDMIESSEVMNKLFQWLVNQA